MAAGRTPKILSQPLSAKTTLWPLHLREDGLRSHERQTEQLELSLFDRPEGESRPSGSEATLAPCAQLSFRELSVCSSLAWHSGDPHGVLEQSGLQRHVLYARTRAQENEILIFPAKTPQARKIYQSISDRLWDEHKADSMIAVDFVAYVVVVSIDSMGLTMHPVRFTDLIKKPLQVELISIEVIFGDGNRLLVRMIEADSSESSTTVKGQP